MADQHNIILLPGDGIGPEVTRAMQTILNAVAAKFALNLHCNEKLFGGAAIDATGTSLPDDTLSACLASNAVFLGAVGDPKYDGAPVRPEQGLLSLRAQMQVFANLRPVAIMTGLEDFSPLRAERVHGTDMLIVRELTGGVYFGEREESDENASDLCRYSRAEVERVARIAFTAAQARSGKLVSVDKANVLATSRLWRNAVNALHRNEFPDVELTHQLVDSMAMKLITDPSAYDVMLTENMFGDILSDEASVISGSIGLLPSASLGTNGPGLYEPIHGSAPDIAGQDIANPIGAILSAAMMLRHSLGLEEPAAAIEAAVQSALGSGLRTYDLGGDIGCSAAAAAIAGQLKN
jgi:3-isopropylmalate dehydrogenase